MSGLPILYSVSEGGFDKHLEVLLSKGADPSARDSVSLKKPNKDSLNLLQVSGKSAVVAAGEGNHVNCLKLLAISGANLNATYGNDKLAAVHRYCMCHRDNIDNVLITLEPPY